MFLHFLLYEIQNIMRIIEKTDLNAITLLSEEEFRSREALFNTNNTTVNDKITPLCYIP